MSYKKQELFLLQELLCSSQGFGGIRVVTYIYIPRRVSYKKQELLTLQELLASSQEFGGIRVVTYIGNTASVV